MSRDYSSFDKKITWADIADYKKRNSGMSVFDVLDSHVMLVIVGMIIMLSYIFFRNPLVLGVPVFIGAISFILLLVVVALITFSQLYFDKMNIIIKLRQFADSNGMEYLLSEDNIDRSGMIFNVGKERSAYDILRCDGKNKIEVANYRYSIGSGKEKKLIECGYLMIELDRNLPHIVLDSKKNNFNLLGVSISNLPVSFKKDQVLSLEGDFDKYFKLYAPKDYETDALYIFNPLLMALFIDESCDYDAEIVDDCLYVYSSEPFNFKKRETLERVFQVIDTVMVKTTNTTKRYHDERTGSGFNSNVIHASGAKLRRGLRWLPILVFILYCIFILTRTFVN